MKVLSVTFNTDLSEPAGNSSILLVFLCSLLTILLGATASLSLKALIQPVDLTTG